MDEIEIFVPIKKYKGLYEISSFGNLKILAKERGANKMRMPERIKNSFHIAKLGRGYYTFQFFKRGVGETRFIHRIVAKHFKKNPLNLPEVNHIDGDTFNNHASNLEWCTRLQNEQHAWETGLKNMIGKNHFKSIPVIQMDLDGNDIKRWESAGMIFSAFGFYPTHIRNCCANKNKTAYGFKWKNAI